MQRHKTVCLRETQATARAKRLDAGSDSLVDQVNHLQTLAMGILGRAVNTNQLNAAVGAAREARGCLMDVARLAGELDERPQVNVQVNILQTPEWLVIKQTLGSYPEARAAVAEALATLGQQAALPSG